MYENERIEIIPYCYLVFFSRGGGGAEEGREVEEKEEGELRRCSFSLRLPRFSC